MTTREKIDAILDWASENPGFDTSFIDSIAVHFDRHGRLTPTQEESLDNIIQGYRILES